MNSEKDFSAVVLVEAKKIFERDQKYLQQIKMDKLVGFVSIDLNYALTYGWYKYGLYPPYADFVSKECSKSGNLQDFHVPNIHKISENFKEIIPEIRESIWKFKDIFVRDTESFLNWVYSQAPPKYREFYSSKMQFDNRFGIFTNHFWINYYTLDDDYFSLITSISQLYENVTHVSDEEVFDYFYDYMDLLEMTLLKIKNIDFERSENNSNHKLLENLNSLFRAEDGLLTLLVPFKQTLVGPDAEKFENWIDKKVANSKTFLDIEIKKLYEIAKSSNLLPTKRELEEDAKFWSDGERKSLREVL